MAEIIGVVASGIAIGQLAIGIVQGTRNIRELEVLGQSLLFLQQDLENHPYAIDPAAAIGRILDITKKAATELNDIARELSIGHEQSKAQRQRKKWQALIRKGDLSKIREKLHRAVTYLNVAVNGYSMSIQSQQLSLMTRISAQLSPPSQDEQHNSNSQLTGKKSQATEQPIQRKVVRRSHRFLGLATCIHNIRNEAATWRQSTSASSEGTDVIHEEWRLLPRAWTKANGVSIQWTRRLGNWQYSFRTIRVVDEHSQIFEACAVGDIQQVIRLLSTRAATTSDVNDQGDSLLHISSMHNQSEMSKWLLRHGADIDLWNNVGLTPLHCSSLAYFNPEKCHDTLRVLLENGLADANQDMGGGPFSTALHVFHGPAEAFEYLSTFMQTNYDGFIDYTIPWQSGRCYGALPTKYAKAIFERTLVSPERAAYVDDDETGTGTGRSLLHAVAANLASAAFHFDESDAIYILHQVLAAKPDLHPRDRYGATPFDYLCYGVRSSKIKYPQEKSQHAVLLWLQALNCNGVSVQEYAEEELRLHITGALIHCRQRRVSMIRRFACEFGGLDHSLYLVVKDEKVQSSEQNLPGAWPEFDDNDNREIVDDMEPLADWTLRFEPLVFEVGG
ncbi:hypothetical protein F4801DRAFT_601725 [Xylaria longipes]|nr:hypothetical protein F4801DRAFT_601725 [Xylaria longipes]